MAELTTQQKKDYAGMLYLKENLTMQEIAEKVNVTRQTVSRWIKAEKWEERKVGITLTTEASDKGTQALGTVHRKVEDRLALADRKYLLDLLNYEMTDIFSAMGIDTSGGEFLFKEPKDIDLNQRMDIASKMDALGLPLDEEQLYEETGFRKPSDYERRKQERRETVQPAPIPMPVSGGGKPEKPDDPEEDKAKGMFKALKRFFGQAPRGEGALGW